jgi:hypothetical protein
MSPLTDEASKIVAKAASLDRKVAKAKQERNEAIRAAQDAGASLRDIAGPVGLSVETVRKICQEDW